MTEPFRLAGVYSVLPTVFHDDGRLDLDGTASVVRATRDAGVAGLTVLGVMGEAAELTEDERRAVLACVATAAPDLPKVVGVSGDFIGPRREPGRDGGSLGGERLDGGRVERRGARRRAFAQQRARDGPSSSRTTRSVPA